MEDEAKTLRFFWGCPHQSRKYHIFTDDGMSLCRKWGFFNAVQELPQGQVTPGKDDCKECVRAINKTRKSSELN